MCAEIHKLENNDNVTSLMFRDDKHNEPETIL